MGKLCHRFQWREQVSAELFFVVQCAVQEATLTITVNPYPLEGEGIDRNLSSVRSVLGTVGEMVCCNQCGIALI